MSEPTPELTPGATALTALAELPELLINLFKSVLYRSEDERLWAALLRLQSGVRDYVSVIGLELLLDEAEGYAFLKARAEPEADDIAPTLPRLVTRRPLPYAVSLLLALLRKKLAEFDAAGNDSRLVLTREEIAELVRVFLPHGPNEARLIDQLESTINKVVELGFLHKLKAASSGALPSFEVRRILKAFVDAQWLAEFDARLGDYQKQLAQLGQFKDAP